MGRSTVASDSVELHGGLTVTDHDENSGSRSHQAGGVRPYREMTSDIHSGSPNCSP